MHSALAELIPTTLTLAGVVGLVLLGGRAARLAGFGRYGPRHRGAGAGQLLLCDSLPLDRVRRLHVVRWNGRDLLLLTGGGSDQVVGWAPDAGAGP